MCTKWQNQWFAQFAQHYATITYPISYSYICSVVTCADAANSDVEDDANPLDVNIESFRIIQSSDGHPIAGGFYAIAIGI